MNRTTAFRTALAVGCTLAVLGTAGCSGGTSSTSGYGAPSSAVQTTPAAQSSAPVGALALKMANTSLGSVLVDGAGMTLYMFAKDSANTSACEGQCLVNWPPLLGAPTAGAGVDDSKLGSFTRTDGRVQATYNGWPLYYWFNDKSPGDVSGQGVQGVWFVLDRDGTPMK